MSADKLSELFTVIADAAKAREARIEQLERELAESREREIAFFEANEGLGQSCSDAHDQLASEKALADRLYEAATWDALILAHIDYRKARGI